MDTIIPAQHSKVVKIPKKSKTVSDRSTKHSHKTVHKPSHKEKHSDSDDTESTIEEESEQSSSDQSSSEQSKESESEAPAKPSKAKKVKQKHHKPRQTHIPNNEFTEAPTEKDLKDVLMKEIDEEIDLNRHLSRRRRRKSSKKSKSLKESFVLKLEQLRERAQSKTFIVSTIVIVVLCILCGIWYYIHKKHPNFFKNMKESIARKKHSDTTDKIFN